MPAYDDKLFDPQHLSILHDGPNLAWDEQKTSLK